MIFLKTHLKLFFTVAATIPLLLQCGASFDYGAIFRGDTPIRFSVTTLQMGEGEKTSVALSLLSQPASQVKIPLTVGDNSEIEISADALFFDSGNYNIPQTFEVRALDDCLADGSQTTMIKTSGLESSDSKFNMIEDVSIPITINDSIDNLPNIYFSANSNLETSELGTNAFFKVRLSCPPAIGETVTVPITNNQSNEVSVDKQSISFTRVDINDLSYASYQTIVLTGLSDCALDGNKNFIIATGNVVSNDTRFDRYHAGKAASGQYRQTTIEGVNKDVAVSNALKVTTSPNDLKMVLNDFVGPAYDHNDQYMTFSASLTCPITGSVNFSFRSIDINDPDLSTDPHQALTSPQLFDSIFTSSNNPTFITFSASDWNQNQSVLLKLDSAITTNTPLESVGLTNYRILIYESNTAEIPIVNSVYDDVYLQPNISYTP